MMLLIAWSVALLVAYAGVQLLIQSKKEMLGSIYNCIAWFFIASALLILFMGGAFAIARCCRYGVQMIHREHRMKEGEGHQMKEHFKARKMMMFHHHNEGEEHCMGSKSCSDEVSGCCSRMGHNESDSLKNCMKK